MNFKDDIQKRNVIIGTVVTVLFLFCCCGGFFVNLFKLDKKVNKGKTTEEITVIATATPTATEEPTPTETPAPTPTPTPVEYKNIAYGELARFPDKYKKSFITFSGKVIQVIEESGEDEVNFRIAVNGDYNSIILCIYTYIDKTKGRILEDDYVNFKGMYTGTTTYESTMGGNITIPAMILTDINIK